MQLLTGPYSGLVVDSKCAYSPVGASPIADAEHDVVPMTLQAEFLHVGLKPLMPDPTSLL